MEWYSFSSPRYANRLISACSSGGMQVRLTKARVRYPAARLWSKMIRPSRESLEKLNMTTRSCFPAWSNPSSSSEPLEGSKETESPRRRKRKVSIWAREAEAFLPCRKICRAEASASTAR